jgi:4-diphosphocytidyl-2-C-methyl-D-erythritol kinase
MEKIYLKAPAKINLGLQILNKRQDGYHNINTIFAKVNICDEITITPNSDLVVNTISNEEIPLYDNLVFKAAKKIVSYTKLRKYGARITLDKNIPFGAGLGGGSSDAASTLIGLNEFWELGLSKEQSK